MSCWPEKKTKTLCHVNIVTQVLWKKAFTSSKRTWQRAFSRPQPGDAACDGSWENAVHRDSSDTAGALFGTNSLTLSLFNSSEATAKLTSRAINSIRVVSIRVIKWLATRLCQTHRAVRQLQIKGTQYTNTVNFFPKVLVGQHVSHLVLFKKASMMSLMWNLSDIIVISGSIAVRRSKEGSSSIHGYGYIPVRGNGGWQYVSKIKWLYDYTVNYSASSLVCS